MAWMIPVATTMSGMWIGQEEAAAQRQDAARVDRLNQIEAKYSWNRRQPAQYRQRPGVGSEMGQMLAGGMTGLQMGMGAYGGMQGKTPTSQKMQQSKPDVNPYAFTKEQAQSANPFFAQSLADVQPLRTRSFYSPWGPRG